MGRPASSLGAYAGSLFLLIGLHRWLPDARLLCELGARGGLATEPMQIQQTLHVRLPACCSASIEASPAHDYAEATQHIGFAAQFAQCVFLLAESVPGSSSLQALCHSVGWEL